MFCCCCCCCYSRAPLLLLLRFPTSCIVEFRLCVAKKGNVRSCWYSVLAHTHRTHLALGTYPLSVLYANCQWKYLLFPILYFNVIRSAFCPVLMLVLSLFCLFTRSLARAYFFPRRRVCIPLISLSFSCALYFYILDVRSRYHDNDENFYLTSTLHTTHIYLYMYI